MDKIEKVLEKYKIYLGVKDVKIVVRPYKTGTAFSDLTAPRPRQRAPPEGCRHSLCRGREEEEKRGLFVCRYFPTGVITPVGLYLSVSTCREKAYIMNCKRCHGEARSSTCIVAFNTPWITKLNNV